ncbi:MAG: ATP-binding cassette domain-containing protein [Salinivirgaceae bacterium]|jgi:cobalt/nickel transport system ATP-binding protein|nr:ATP-binding cassette domain-containing protein [Salinivirgaceae bacterium]
MDKSIIDIHHASYSYPSGTLALDGINLSLPKGKKIALLGGNGAGKSTLMLLLNGVLVPTSGHLSFDDTKYNYKKSKLRELRSKVGLLFSDPDNQLIAPTVYEEISFGLNNLLRDKQRVRAKVEDTLDAFCLHDIQRKTPHDLSAGQKKRVCLASILAMEPEVIICDEPSSSLDPWHTNLTFNYLDSLQEKGKTILISTHDVNLAYSWADHTIILKKGKVLISGASKDVFSKKDIIEEAGLNLPFIIDACNAFIPELKANELPANMDEFKKLLKSTLCTDF